MLRRILCAFISCVMLCPAFAVAEELQDAVHNLPDEALLYLYAVVVEELQARGIAVPQREESDALNQSTDSSIRKAADAIASSAPRATLAPTYAPLIHINDIDTVYISKSGERYHTIPDCCNMQNPSAVTLAEAVASGREPCRDCAYWLSELEE